MNQTLLKFSRILSEEFVEFDSVINSAVDNNVELLREILRYVKRTSGKKLRVMLLFLVCKLYRYQDFKMIKLGAAIELLHCATLLHDDVIDKSKKRRGILSANKIWHNRDCVLSGDFLFSKAFSMLVEINIYDISAAVADSSAAVIAGEILQHQYNANGNINIAQYLEIISKKTAPLFSVSAKCAGILSGAPIEEVQILEKFGFYLGMAFQMMDDILDYFGSSKTLGKQIGVDFKEEKITLPVIILCDIVERDIFESLWVKNKHLKINFMQLLSAMKQKSVKDLSMQYAINYIDKAKSELSLLPKEQPFYDLLSEILEFLTNRNL